MVTPKRSNEDVLVFVVPGLKRQAAIDGCHRYLGLDIKAETAHLASSERDSGGWVWPKG